MINRFLNRVQAGEMLGERLQAYQHRRDVIVLGLPRGGVPVAYAIAEKLEVQMDILLVRKLGIPGNEELAMGAVTHDGVCVLRPEVIAALDIPPEVIEAAAQRELREMHRRSRLYRPGRHQMQLQHKVVIVVDDGLATGATMQAAVRAVRHAQPAKVIAAIPVAAAQSSAELSAEVDEIVCLYTPEWFSAVSQFFDDFTQVSDAEVKQYLADAEQWHIPEDMQGHNNNAPYQGDAARH
jgi:putative phosphoribosyl transferase